MTSRTSSSECFVYINLPGDLSAVTAGRFVVTKNARGHALGQFVYRAKLSPAYDLTPSVPASLERRDLALESGDQGRYANAKNILSQHARFLLDRAEAEKIVNDMKAQVEATWYDTLRNSGVSQKDAETIRGAFVYPGFTYDPDRAGPGSGGP